ncbi:MAG TPA: ROK family protein, partial [Chloroflexota bacterium]|nr:ROK family protein [Chloroflexota bacterium]
LAEAVAQDDKVTRRVLKRAAEYLGYGIASAINLIDPDMIIIGGGVVEALGDTFLNWAIKVARPNCISEPARATPIVRAALGDDAGMLGAALLARDEEMRR